MQQGSYGAVVRRFQAATPTMPPPGEELAVIGRGKGAPNLRCRSAGGSVAWGWGGVVVDGRDLQLKVGGGGGLSASARVTSAAVSRAVRCP